MNPLASSQRARRVLMTLAATIAISLTLGCGNSVTIVPAKGGFSKASLSGSYAFTVKGYGFNVNSGVANYFVEGGVFTADGNGNITAGTHDFVEVVGTTTQSFLGNGVTGTYTINKDGTGDLVLNLVSGPLSGVSEALRITLSDTGHLYMQEEDSAGTSTGSAELQTSTTTPTGNFVFRTHDVFVSATMGTMAISAGAVSGSFLMVENGTPVTGSIGAGGSIVAPSAGRGTITYSVNGLTHTAQYYVVSSSKFLLLDTTTNILSIGLAEQQSGSPFSPASLSSSYAFGSSGETATGFVNTVGVFTTDGTANVTAANYDSVQDGAVVASNQTATGTYLIDNALGNGSGSITIGGLVRDIWMVSPTRAYFIALNGVNVEDGTLDQQSGAFTNTLTQAAFFMDGFDATGIDGLFKDRVGTLVPSGTNSLATNYVASFFDISLVAGGASPNSFTGSYSVASNGRTTTVLNGFTNNIVLYLTTNSTGYLLQADTGVNMSGTFTAQPTQ
jgi:hypothetical protein